MTWFKKSDAVPELPPAPRIQLPEVRSNFEKKELPELPSFPNSPSGESFNQQMVKSAVSDSYSSEDNEVLVEELPRDFHLDRDSSLIPSIPAESKKEKQNEEKRTIELNSSFQKTRQVEPIFVRIDKFQAAQKDFDEVKKKIREIDSVLNKIKDEKEKERQEIDEWTSDLERIKSRLSEIDENIFNQI